MSNSIHSVFCRLSVLTVLVCMMMQSASSAVAKTMYIQLKVYHFQQAQQEQQLDQYLSNAYLPALHKLGFKQVAVFKPLKNSENADKLIYVLTYSDRLENFAKLDVNLEKDKQYQEAGKSYLDLAHNNPPFQRIETILMRAFDGMPFVELPKLKSDKRDRVYELRSYEGPTEKLAANKVSMFNNGEIEIFKKLNFNAVFYGQVIAGSTMPNLMYLTTFENMADRDEHWKAFGPLYKPMSEMPQYQNNVSKNVTILCAPTAYSDY